MGDKIYLAVEIQKLLIKKYVNCDISYAEVLELADRQD